MGLLPPDKLDALTREIARRHQLWAIHEVKETLTEAPRTVGSGYSDTELLYIALTSGFDDANDAAVSGEDLHGRVEALARQLEIDYVIALRDPRTREEITAMVAMMLHAARECP